MERPYPKGLLNKGNLIPLCVNSGLIRRLWGSSLNYYKYIWLHRNPDQSSEIKLNSHLFWVSIASSVIYLGTISK